MIQEKTVKKDLVGERAKLLKDFEILSQTEGFGLLSKRQQRFIKISLYLHARTERGKVLSYRKSQTHVLNWFCHAAIASLEGRCDLGLNPELIIPKEYFYAEYQKISQLKDIVNLIESFGFPSVVIVNSDPNNRKSRDSMTLHSFLCLGHDKDSNIVVWEKQGYQYPYHLTTLNNVYATFGEDHYGIRKLVGTKNM